MLYKRFALREAHGGALMGHLKINTVYKMLHKHFFWLKIKHDVHKFCSKCFKRKETKCSNIFVSEVDKFDQNIAKGGERKKNCILLQR